MNADHTAAKSHELKRVSPEPGREQTASGQKGAGKKGAAKSCHCSDLLDGALNDTFPGSDPVSITQPVGEQLE